jgi:hypothetical protein
MWPAPLAESIATAMNESVGTCSVRMDDPHHQRGSGTAINERFAVHNSSRKDRPVLPNGRHVVGIDIGQKFHAAAGVTAVGQDFGRMISFDNTRAGVDRLEQILLKPLGGPAKILIGMEATGHYWMPPSSARASARPRPTNSTPAASPAWSSTAKPRPRASPARTSSNCACSRATAGASPVSAAISNASPIR